MICCDACDNWFHGYCVGITKAMGEKMEQNGSEWLCPSCKKEKTANERESKQKLSTRSITNRSSAATKRRNSQTGADSANSSVYVSIFLFNINVVFNFICKKLFYLDPLVYSLMLLCNVKMNGYKEFFFHVENILH